MAVTAHYNEVAIPAIGHLYNLIHGVSSFNDDLVGGKGLGLIRGFYLLGKRMEHFVNGNIVSFFADERFPGLLVMLFFDLFPLIVSDVRPDFRFNVRILKQHMKNRDTGAIQVG